MRVFMSATPCPDGPSMRSYHILAFFSQSICCFIVKRLGPMEKNAKFVGLEITRDRAAKTITIHQSRYIKDILKKYNLHEAAPANHPVPVGKQYFKKNPEDPSANQHYYQSMIGSLMFLMLGSRPDLAYACGLFSRFNADPSLEHIQGLKRVYRYVSGTSTWGIKLGGHTEVACWTDASYADEKDSAKSTGAYLLKLGEGPVSWSSKVQKIVTLSTMEAEYTSASDACQEVAWLTSLLSSFNLDCRPVAIYCDNQAAVQLANNPRSRGRSRHMNVRQHYIRDKIEGGDVTFTWTSTATQLADALTKPVSNDKMVSFRELAGMVSKDEEDEREG